MAGGVWRIPAERMKVKVEHLVSPIEWAEESF